MQTKGSFRTETKKNWREFIESAKSILNDLSSVPPTQHSHVRATLLSQLEHVRAEAMHLHKRLHEVKSDITVTPHDEKLPLPTIINESEQVSSNTAAKSHNNSETSKVTSTFITGEMLEAPEAEANSSKTRGPTPERTIRKPLG